MACPATNKSVGANAASGCPISTVQSVICVVRVLARRYDAAATLKRGGRWGADITLAQMPKLDLVVMGSVAVTRDGRRLGKGHGYADLEYALLCELGNPPVPIATTVHRLQVLDDFPVEAHDAPVALIATPEELIEVKRRRRPPRGIDW